MKMDRLQATTTTQDDLTATWEEFKRTNDPDLRAALVVNYAPLAIRAAAKVAANVPAHVDRADLESAGMIGLMESVDRFKLDAGTKFETFCSARVRGAIMDELRSQDWLPRMLRIRIHKIDRIARKLETTLGREARHGEIASEIGLSTEKVKQALTYKGATFFSLDRCRCDNNGNGANEMKSLKDSRNSDPAGSILKEELRDVIANRLTKIEKLIVMLYYYEQLTMREVGEALSMSESRVCQIHSKIISELKQHLS
jgi:RNA polymerase sigma factor for flagellar operon FliA